MAPSLLQVIFLVWFHCYREGAISKLYDNPHMFDLLDSFSRIWVIEVNSNWSLTMLLAQWGSKQKPAVEKGLNPLKGQGWFIAVAGRLGENAMNFGDREVMGIMEPSKDDKHI